MIEQVYQIATGEEAVVEKVIQDENIHYIHMVFKKEGGLPEHFANATVYMTVVKGILSIGLDGQAYMDYEAGTVLKIPYKTKMNVRNRKCDLLELIVIKAPAPGK